MPDRSSPTGRAPPPAMESRQARPPAAEDCDPPSRPGQHSAKGRRGNRESEGLSNEKPQPGPRDRKPLGRGMTSRGKTRTGSGSLGSSPARYCLVSNPLVGLGRGAQ
jgi:hypothetical protein